jgi:hypothetical protein
MATEALKSTAITNRDATPQVKNSSYLEAGLLRECVGTMEMTTADLGSTYRFCQVPSNCRISQIQLFSDDVGNAGAMDFGIYQTTANGGAVVDADFFASAVDINAAALNGTDITYEAATSTAQIDDIDKLLWVQLGLSADPGIMYDIVGTSTTAAGTGGTISLRVRYVV